MFVWRFLHISDQLQYPGLAFALLAVLLVVKSVLTLFFLSELIDNLTLLHNKAKKEVRKTNKIHCIDWFC